MEISKIVRVLRILGTVDLICAFCFASLGDPLYIVAFGLATMCFILSHHIEKKEKENGPQG